MTEAFSKFYILPTARYLKHRPSTDFVRLVKPLKQVRFPLDQNKKQQQLWDKNKTRADNHLIEPCQLILIYIYKKRHIHLLQPRSIAIQE